MLQRRDPAQKSRTVPENLGQRRGLSDSLAVMGKHAKLVLATFGMRPNIIDQAHSGGQMTSSCTNDVPRVDAGVPAPVAQRQHLIARLVYSQSTAARLFRWAALALAIALCLKSLSLGLQSLLPEYVYRKDFMQEYTLARAIAEGVDPYLPTETLAARYVGALPGVVFSHPTPHPPTAGILVLPFALLRYRAAASVWLGLEIACSVASAYLLCRSVSAQPSLRATLGIATLLLGWHPFYTDLIVGQLMVPMLVAMCGAWLALRSGRSALGGALVGLTMLLKPVAVAVLLVFIFRRDWRALAGAVSVVLLGYAAAGAVIGLGTLEAYFTTVLPLVARGYRAHVGNISAWTLGWRLFDGTGSALLMGIEAPPLVRSTLAAQVVSIGLPLLLLLMASLSVRKQRSLEVSLGVMVLVSILIVPIAWNNYLVLAVLPGAQVVRWLARHRFPPRETNLAILVAMLHMPDGVRVTALLAWSAPVVRGNAQLPFALALLTFMPAVAVGALAWLVAFLGRTDTSIPAAEELRQRQTVQALQ